VALRLRAGGTYDHVEIENAAGEVIGDSGHGFGWEAGARLRHPPKEPLGAVARGSLSLADARPRLRRPTTSGTLEYLAVEAGVLRSF
jgi:hypothetical protein